LPLYYATHPKSDKKIKTNNLKQNEKQLQIDPNDCNMELSKIFKESAESDKKIIIEVKSMKISHPRGLPNCWDSDLKSIRRNRLDDHIDWPDDPAELAAEWLD
jgi:hypothetical protein